jgi:hypothetical protein
MFFYRFDMLISKIDLKKYFDVFSYKKHFEKQLLPHF